MILYIYVCEVLSPSLGWKRLVTLNPTEIMSWCNTGAGVSEEIKVLQLLLGGTKQVFSFPIQLLRWLSAGKAEAKVSCLIVAPQVETLSCYCLSPCQALTAPCWFGPSWFIPSLLQELMYQLFPRETPSCGCMDTLCWAGT